MNTSSRMTVRTVPFARLGHRKTRTGKGREMMQVNGMEESRIARFLADAIIDGNETDEIPFRGGILRVEAKMTTDLSVRTTGVEWLGEKERFTETIHHITSLKAGPFYDREGNDSPITCRHESIREKTNAILDSFSSPFPER